MAMATIHQPCEIIGIGMNGRKVSPQIAQRSPNGIEDDMQLPVVDVIRDGADRLIDAAEQFYHDGRWRNFGM